MDALERILSLAMRHVPQLRLVDKHDYPLWRIVGLGVRPLMPGFMEHVTTVIGDTVYLPCPAEHMPRDLLAQILAHELVHQLDQREHGWWFYASYALAPLPAGRTMRAHWERRAYAVDLMLAHEGGGEPALRRCAERVTRYFAGPDYGFMWAGQEAARRYLGVIEDEIRAGTLQKRTPYDEILTAWRG
jgi:hypothetical protein